MWPYFWSPATEAVVLVACYSGRSFGRLIQRPSFWSPATEAVFLVACYSGRIFGRLLLWPGFLKFLNLYYIKKSKNRHDLGDCFLVNRSWTLLYIIFEQKLYLQHYSWVYPPPSKKVPYLLE